MKDYLPSNDAELTIWLNNYRTKLANYSEDFDLSAADMKEINNKSTSLTEAIQDVATKKEEVAKAVTNKNNLRASILKELRREIARIKVHKKYTEAIGQELGIIGSSKSFDADSYKPVLTAEVIGGIVRIKFQKKGVDGVNIYHRKKGESSWRFLARDTRSPYEDRIKLADAAQPEHWEYRAYGVVNDTEIGQPSDVVEVIYGE